ncbi:MAG: hypothetical protein IT258_05900, partial [Saprospiraceae bacterium]|nr:hypothetical protein [Saprospiraceae bacterium]
MIGNIDKIGDTFQKGVTYCSLLPIEYKLNSRASIENLYTIFSAYPLKGRLHHCPCGCISEEQEREIYKAPLRQLSYENLGFYATKAMTTWGELNDYKHFLPRIIELYAANEYNGNIDLTDIHNKLKYGDWQNWPAAEQEGIKAAILHKWTERVNHNEANLSLFDLKEYGLFFTIKTLFKAWQYPENPVALRNFIEFCHDEMQYIFNPFEKLKIDEEDKKEELLRCFKKDGLIESLEALFFEVEAKDAEYAYIVSI